MFWLKYLVNQFTLVASGFLLIYRANFSHQVALHVERIGLHCREARCKRVSLQHSTRLVFGSLLVVLSLVVSSFRCLLPRTYGLSARFALREKQRPRRLLYRLA